MTSNLKCPFCGKELQQGTPDTYSCPNIYCPQAFSNWGSIPLWQALIQAKQDLEIAKADIEDYKKYKALWEQIRNNTILELERKLGIARKALKEMERWLGVIRCSMVSHLNNQNNTLLEHYETDPTVQNIDKAKNVLKQHIEQIEHKE